MRLPIVNACHEDWDAMDPHAEGRRCRTCAHAVLDLTVVTEPRARRLLAERRGERTCVRVRVRPDGHAVFKPSPPAALPGAAALVIAACTPHAPEPAPRVETAELAQPAPLPTLMVVPDAPPVAREAPAAAKTRPKKPVKPKEYEFRDDDLLMGFIE